jgi:subtilisin family serine protease
MGAKWSRAWPAILAVVTLIVSAIAITPNRPDLQLTYLVVTESDTAARTAQVEALKLGGRVTHTYSESVSGFAAELSVKAAASLTRLPGVRNVQPDTAMSLLDTTPLWDLDPESKRTVELPTDSGKALAALAGAVVVYVVDTGVLANHVELAGRVAPGFTAIADGFGTSDPHGHGTHVAGIVAGATNGVAKNAVIVPVRVAKANGLGSWTSAVAGLEWIAARHIPGTPAVANISVSGPANVAVDDAVRKLIAKGVTVVVAAGNSNADAILYSPARVAEAITVAASNADERASYSNYGSAVTLFAPGNDIQTACISSSTAMTRVSGTSMAAPQVAGAAALALSQSPGLKPAQVMELLVRNATANVITKTAGAPNLLLCTDGLGTAHQGVHLATDQEQAAVAAAKPAAVATKAPVKKPKPKPKTVKKKK